MTANFMKFDETTIRNICRACCTSNCLPVSEALQEKIVFEWGEKDFDLKITRKNREKYFPLSKVTIREGYGHCVYMATHTEAYVRDIMQELEEV